jgi:hypothetical protein
LETLYNIKVQGVMADNGTEFINSELTKHFKSKGITLFTSVPYTPEQNGVAERGICTITEGARAMLFASTLPKNMWSFAVKTMAYLRNRSLSNANEGQTAIHQLTGSKPDLSHLRIFGCPISVAIPKQKRQKWDSRSKMGYMVGYEPYSSGYLVWFPGSKRIEKARDIIFHEEAVVPAIPILYGDDEGTKMSKSSSDSIQSEPVEPKMRLTIRIPPRPVPKSPNNDQTNPVHHTPDDSQLVSNTPDYPQGMTRSGKIREGIQNAILAEEENNIENFDCPVILSAMTRDPTIQEALRMPGEEGKAWEEA